MEEENDGNFWRRKRSKIFGSRVSGSFIFID